MTFTLTPLKAPHESVANKELCISMYCPWSHLINSTTFMTIDGAIGSVIAVRGLAFEVSEYDEINRAHKRLASFWQSLPESMGVYITHHRHEHNVYPQGQFNAGFAKDFNDAYQKTFDFKALYANDLYITLMVKAPIQQGTKKATFIKKLFSPKTAHKPNTKQLQTLQQAVMEALNALADFTPCVLGDGQGNQSALLSFLSLLINAQTTLSPIVHPHPNVSLNTYLPQKRISTKRNTIEFHGNSNQDHHIGALLSIKSYASESRTLGLKSLLGLDMTFISTHVFLRAPKNNVVNLMGIQLNHLTDANDHALSQQDALEQACDGVASDFVAFGTYQHTMLVLNKTHQQLDEQVAMITQCYAQAGLTLIRETLNLESACFSQWVGNFKFIKRGVLVSTENFADYAPLHNYHHGYVNGNHLGSAAMRVQSQGKTPLYLNFHERGSIDNPSLGHTLILAPSNAGKTSLLCALQAMMQKYQYSYHTPTPKPSSYTAFFFDRDRSCEIFIRACNGFYSTITQGIPTGFNPLQLEDTPKNRTFLIHWFSRLLLGNEELPQSHLSVIEQLIDRNFTLDKSSRRLSIIAQFLPINFPYLEHLKPWVQGGSLAYLFDNPEDTLNLDNTPMAGFDMTHLISNTNKGRSGCVFDYLFHRIEMIMDGRLISLTMEESWQFLEHPYWIDKMAQFIPSTRKYNLFLTFVTQSMEKVLNSPLSSYLLQNTATQFFLGNEKAEKDTYMTGFHLSEGQYNFIHDKAKSTRSFLFRQGNEVAVGRIDFTGLEDYLNVFSANEKSVRLCERIRNQMGNNPKDWLPVFLKQVKSV